VIRNRVYWLPAVLALAGCAEISAPPPPPPAAALQSDQTFLAVDPAAQASIRCPALAPHLLADGRLEVLASLANSTGQPVTVQAACIFKDTQGAPTGEAISWQKLTLAAKAVETLRFVSADARAQKFTVAVQSGR